MTRYMVIERFRQGARAAIYARMAERGRMLPDGLRYVDSWVASDGSERCWQLMDAADPALFDEWTNAWSDLVEFEIVPVEGSRDAAAAAGRVA